MDKKIQFVQYKRILEKGKLAAPYQCTYYVSPYVGCEYNCVYCFKLKDKQPLGEVSDGLSGLIQVKENAPEILRKELKSVKKGVVCITGYQNIEKEQRVIRKILEVVNARRFPLHIITMSDIVLDDLDLLSKIAENNWCTVSFRINTLDTKISKIFEPNSPLPEKRIEAMGKFAENGITTGIALSPIIPYITDSSEGLEEIIEKSAEKNASYVIAETLKLKDECRARVVEVIKRHFPELLLKYKNLYEFGSSPDIRYTNKLRNVINFSLKKYGIPNTMPSFTAGRMRKQAKIKDFSE